MKADSLPRGDFTPPVHRISGEAPWEWLAGGWRDTFVNPGLSLGYGAAFVIAGAAIFFGLAALNMGSWIAVAAGGFLLVGPMLAVGLYEISRRYELNQSITLTEALFVRTRSPLQLAYMGFLLLFAFLVWARVAQLLFALFAGGTVTVAQGAYPDVLEFVDFITHQPSGWMLLAVGSVFGAVIAFSVFAMTAVSVPMLMERDTDLFTAVATSIKAVAANPGPMVLWAWIIAVVIGTSIATLGLGLIVAFPLIGHATWRAYRALVQ
jgi:uncharacterized membrane protein